MRKEEENVKENIRFAYVLKDGTVVPIQVSGVCNVIDAVFELASSIMHGDLDVDPDNIIKIVDIPG
jgi:hypothetical protein